MKITKARLKQIIIEELEAVMKEDEDEEQIDEAGFISQSAVNPPSHRDRPGYQRATLRGRGAPPEDPGTAATPTLDAAADALGLTPSDLMVQLAQVALTVAKFDPIEFSLVSKALNQQLAQRRRGSQLADEFVPELHTDRDSTVPRGMRLCLPLETTRSSPLHQADPTRRWDSFEKLEGHVPPHRHQNAESATSWLETFPL